MERENRIVLNDGKRQMTASGNLVVKVIDDGKRAIVKKGVVRFYKREDKLISYMDYEALTEASKQAQGRFFTFSDGETQALAGVESFAMLDDIEDSAKEKLRKEIRDFRKIEMFKHDQVLVRSTDGMLIYQGREITRAQADEIEQEIDNKVDKAVQERFGDGL